MWGLRNSLKKILPVDQCCHALGFLTNGAWYIFLVAPSKRNSYRVRSGWAAICSNETGSDRAAFRDVSHVAAAIRLNFKIFFAIPILGWFTFMLSGRVTKHRRATLPNFAVLSIIFPITGFPNYLLQMVEMALLWLCVQLLFVWLYAHRKFRRHFSEMRRRSENLGGDFPAEWYQSENPRKFMG